MSTLKDERKEFIEKLNLFRFAFYALKEKWEDIDTKLFDAILEDVNYPFVKSFDEMKVDVWVESCIKKLNATDLEPIDLAPFSNDDLDSMYYERVGYRPIAEHNEARGNVMEVLQEYNRRGQLVLPKK